MPHDESAPIGSDSGSALPSVPSARLALFLLTLCLTVSAAMHWLVYLPAVQQALVLPLPIRPTRVMSGEFQVKKSLQYRVGIELDRVLPSDRLDALIGEAIADKSNPESMILHLNWRLLRQGQVIASGKSEPDQGGHWGPTIGKTVGHFQGQPGQSYRLELTVLGDLTPLQSTKPRAVVELGLEHKKGPMLNTGLVFLLAFVIGFVSLLELILILYRRRKRSKST